MNEPTIEEVQALDGKQFSMLSPRELEVLDFFRKTGRKHGVEVTIKHDANPEELARASSQDQADEIMRRANSTVSVRRSATNANPQRVNTTVGEKSMKIKVHKLVSGAKADKLNAIVNTHLENRLWQKTEPTFFAQEMFHANLSAEVDAISLPIEHREPGLIRKMATEIYQQNYNEVYSVYRVPPEHMEIQFLMSGEIAEYVSTMNSLRFTVHGEIFDIAVVSSPVSVQRIVVLRRGSDEAYALGCVTVYQA